MLEDYTSMTHLPLYKQYKSCSFSLFLQKRKLGSVSFAMDLPVFLQLVKYH